MTTSALSYGETIRLIRTTAKIRQTDVATGAGVSTSYLSDVESGRRKPPTHEVRRRIWEQICWASAFSFIVLERAAMSERCEDCARLIEELHRKELG